MATECWVLEYVLGKLLSVDLLCAIVNKLSGFLAQKFDYQVVTFIAFFSKLSCYLVAVNDV
jgi:hypothetical protein